MVIAGASWMLGRAAASPTQTPPTTSTIRVARRSRAALVAVVIAAAGSGGPGRAEPQLSQPSLDSGRMRSSLTPLGPPVSRDRVIASFPKWYTPEACLQLREHFHRQVSAACQRRNMGTVGLKLSKVVVVGDLYVGKTSLIHRFCKNVFDRDYKATIGVDFEIERFEIAGIPYSLQIWDTAGQEKFKCIASAYYRGAQGRRQKWISVGDVREPQKYPKPDSNYKAPLCLLGSGEKVTTFSFRLKISKNRKQTRQPSVPWPHGLLHPSPLRASLLQRMLLPWE
ncbi:ras-related protein Rab-36 isoform X2 [Nomascus leucogenys]|uniref:ras-related protein Rab-36 isoform X2 n=1 Tax=Nomascus leucogenys TaxID=61853 RepID=UPI00122D7107|nr:ras-related protein Rab-36 isoform X2 [Nomascus leucogenys]